MYLRIALSNYFLQRELKFFPLTETIPEVYVSTMTIFISNSCNTLEETLTHMNSLNLESYIGKNVTYLLSVILVGSELLESSRTFNTEHLGYIT